MVECGMVRHLGVGRGRRVCVALFTVPRQQGDYSADYGEIERMGSKQ